MKLDRKALAGQPLTRREQDILSCTERGLTRAQTAKDLGITVDTVKTLTRRILAKKRAGKMHELRDNRPTLAQLRAWGVVINGTLTKRDMGFRLEEIILVVGTRNEIHGTAVFRKVR